MHQIPHSKPTITESEAEAVTRVLKSGYHARGPECKAFEEELAVHIGLKSAHSCASGSSALVLAQRGLGLANGATILIPSLACAAVAHAVIEAGNQIALYDSGYAMPSSADCDAFPSADGLVVIAPMEGWTSQIPDWQSGPVILDRCQQLSADPPESRSNAACEVFSFYATKCLSTGSGGAIASKDSELIKRVEGLNSPDKQDDWAPERFNFGFDDIRAAIGREQLKALPSFKERRANIAMRYAEACGQKAPPSGISFRFLLDCGKERANASAAFADAGIDVKPPVFGLLHRQLGLDDAQFPLASAAWERHLSLPIYPSLCESDIERVCSVLRKL